MSHFYGTLTGQARTTATRRGSKSGGIATTAASWRGAVRVELYVDDKGRDCYRVFQTTWHGAGVNKPIKEGVIGK
jgi:hypothetical protein